MLSSSRHLKSDRIFNSSDNTCPDNTSIYVHNSRKQFNPMANNNLTIKHYKGLPNRLAVVQEKLVKNSELQSHNRKFSKSSNFILSLNASVVFSQTQLSRAITNNITTTYNHVEIHLRLIIKLYSRYLYHLNISRLKIFYFFFSIIRFIATKVVLNMHFSCLYSRDT